MISKLREKIEKFPSQPGVYIMRDVNRMAIYVGKAKMLKERILQYLPPTSDNRFFVQRLIEATEDIEVIITQTEKDAFLLENELIKKLKPRYNIRLKDDKNYISIRIDRRHPFPRLEIVRRQKRDGSIYFGPFLRSSEIKQLVKLLRITFKIRDCKDTEFVQRKRPCVQYQIGRCMAPCVFKDEKTVASYREGIERCIRILDGKEREIVSSLREEMMRLSACMQFEEAAQIRDIIRIMDRRLENQRIVKIDAPDMDIFGVASDKNHTSLFILKFRGGRVLEERSFIVENIFLDIRELLEDVIVRLYIHAEESPEEIILPVELGEVSEIQRLISQDGKDIEIKSIKSGYKKSLLDMAHQNALYRLEEFLLSKSILNRIKFKLNLKNIPEKIECYDISHISGKYTVGAKVTAKDGLLLKDEYRRYRINSQSRGDDYAAIYEIISRRLSHTEDELPDLIMIDGGKGQLSACQRAIAKMMPRKGIEVIAIAKERGDKYDRIYKLGSKDYIKLDSTSEESRFLMLLRDEAHRFANDYRTILYRNENL